MKTLEVNDDLAKQLKQLADDAHITTNQFLEQLLLQYKQNKEPVTVQDFFGALKDSPTFKDEPVKTQRLMRDEWER